MILSIMIWVWLLLLFGSTYVGLTRDSETVEWICAVLAIIGFIGLYKYVNRKAEEGGNWLSNKPTFVSREIDTRKKRTVLRLVD